MSRVCMVEGCVEPSVTKEDPPRCFLHLDQKPKKKRKRAGPEVDLDHQCIMDGCTNKRASRGLCWGHYRDLEVRAEYALPAKIKQNSNVPLSEVQKQTKNRARKKKALKDPGEPAGCAYQFTEDIQKLIDKRVDEKVREVLAEVLERVSK